MADCLFALLNLGADGLDICTPGRMLFSATSGTCDGAYGIIDEGLKEINCGDDLFSLVCKWQTGAGNTDVRHNATKAQTCAKIRIYDCYQVVATTDGPGQSEPSLDGSPSASVLTNSS